LATKLSRSFVTSRPVRRFFLGFPLTTTAMTTADGRVYDNDRDVITTTSSSNISRMQKKPETSAQNDLAADRIAAA